MMPSRIFRSRPGVALAASPLVPAGPRLGA